MRGREPFVVWLLLGAVAAEIFLTYSRLPARELYHVSGTGREAGASRVLVFANFPVALIAIALVAVAFEGLRTRGTRALALPAVALSAAVFWPGVVDQANLDARAVNAIAAAGVALAWFLTVAAAFERNASARGDRLRVVLAVLVLLAAPAWLAADLGFFLDGVPVLGRLYRSGPYLPGGAGPPAVHHGHHHGMDGVLLVLASLLLSRLLASIRADGLRLLTAAYLALMLAYGIGNVANDFWLEQVVERGWTSWAVPSVLEPHATWAWAVVAGGAAVVFLAWYSRERPA